jgi:hypothetical protein
MPRIFKRDPQGNWPGFDETTGKALMHAARLMRDNNLSRTTALRQATERFQVSPAERKRFLKILTKLGESHPVTRLLNSTKPTQRPGMVKLYQDCLQVLEKYPYTPSLLEALEILVTEHPDYENKQVSSLMAQLSGRMLDKNKQHLKDLIPTKKEAVKNEMRDYGSVGFAQSVPEAAEIYTRLNPDKVSLRSVSVYWSTHATKADWEASGFKPGIRTTNQPLPEDDEDMLTELLRRAKMRMQEQDSEITTKIITLNDLATALTWPKEKLDELQAALDAIEVPEKGQDIACN